MQHSDVYLICVGYYSKSHFNVMARNTSLHKPTAQRELSDSVQIDLRRLPQAATSALDLDFMTL